MKYILIMSVLALTACATPATVLKNKEGGTVECGGNVMASVLFGRIGYEVQKSMDEDCVKDAKAKGYK